MYYCDVTYVALGLNGLVPQKLLCYLWGGGPENDCIIVKISPLSYTFTRIG